MSKLFVWCFVASLVALATSLPRAEIPVPEIKLENKPGICGYRGHEVKEGETKPGPVGACVNITCRDASAGIDGIDIQACELFQVGKGCTLQDPDLTKIFPDCCAKQICP